MPTLKGEEFFGDLKEWSERKLNILSQYLDPFVKILGSGPKISQVYYVDAFAGKGIYQDGSLGSAMRAAQLASSYRSAGKSYQLKCINIEADPENFANLQTSTQVYGNLVQNFAGTFAENVDQVLAVIAGSPALFFLDPFGVKGMDWDLLRRIIHRGNASDFWIRFDYSAVRRLDGLYDSDSRGAEKGFAILCQAYGIDDPAVLHDKLAAASAEERKTNAINLYLSRLVQELSSARRKGFAAAYPIRTITERDKYSLIFATGHHRGAIVASELICSTEETYQRELEDFKANQPRQLSLFQTVSPTKEQIFEDKTDRLAATIWQECKGEELSRDEVYQRILPYWFGQVRSTHITHALRKMQNDGRIQQVSGRLSDNKTRFTFSS